MFNSQGRSLEEIFDFLPWRFFKKLAIFQSLVTTMAIVGATLFARYTLKEFILHQSKQQLKETLRQTKGLILLQDERPEKWCFKLPSNKGHRITIVALDGQVLCDNYANTENMDNHAKRPEVMRALKGKIGITLRYGKTLGHPMLYGAIMIHPRQGPPLIMRQALPLDTIQKSIRKLDKALWPFLVALILVSGGMSLWGSIRASIPLRKILRKINQIDHTGVWSGGGDEWALVETSIDKTNRDLEKYLEEIYLENKKLGTLMESISDSILAINANYEILFANNHFKSNFLPGEIQDYNVTEFKVLDIIDDQTVKNSFDEAFSQGSQVLKHNLLLSASSAQDKHYYDLRITPLKDPQDKIFGAVGVFHDVTERRLTEQMREDFVSNVSHEVRTPLTAMKGHVQMLKQDSNTFGQHEQAKYHLDKIESNCDRLTNLFNDVLNLSVIESKSEIEKEEVDVKEITEDVLADVTHIYADKNLDYEVHYNATTCLAQALLLEQVLTNLIVNAFKYTPSGGKITIRWSERKFFGPSFPHPCTVLEVEDTGPGIAAEHLPRLFERFYRVDASRSRQMGGTGLGLAIVKHIMQKHNGLALAKSTLKKGSTFTMCFPKVS